MNSHSFRGNPSTPRGGKSKLFHTCWDRESATLLLLQFCISGSVWKISGLPGFGRIHKTPTPLSGTLSHKKVRALEQKFLRDGLVVLRFLLTNARICAKVLQLIPLKSAFAGNSHEDCHLSRGSGPGSHGLPQARHIALFNHRGL